MREDAWLAARLGTPCFTVESDDAPPSLAGEGFWQAKVDCSDVARVGALEEAGFRVVDVNVTLRREAAEPPAAQAGIVVADAQGEDREAVLEIAEHHYDVSRFHLDPHVADDRARLVKRDWAAAVLDGERGERMLVARREGAVAGFLATLAGPVIDLVAVRTELRGAGIGRALVAALGNGAIEVGTQGWNTAAIRFYEHLGFRTVSTRYVLHGHGGR